MKDFSYFNKVATEVLCVFIIIVLRRITAIPLLYTHFRMSTTLKLRPPENGSTPPLQPLRSILQNQGKTAVLLVLPPMALLTLTE